MKKYIKNLLLLTALSVVFSSCENVLDVNESEVDPTSDVVNPDLLLAGALTSHRLTSVNSRSYEVEINELGNIMMNSWAGDVNNVTGGFLDEFSLNLTQNFHPRIWETLYQNCGTAQAIINNPSEDYDNHKAIAQLIKTYYFQYIVDLYGDAPYTEALQFGSNLTPAYDDDQAIYRGLVEDAKRAISWMANADEFDATVGMEDVVFGGDMSGWNKFANTLILKLLMRQSELADVDGETATYLATEFAALNRDFITSDVVINPPYENSVGKQNPFYANYGTDVNGVNTFDRDFITPSEYAAEFLKGAVTEDGTATGVPDNRLTRLFEPLTSGPMAGTVVGVQQGADNTTAPPNLSNLGDGIVKGSDQVSYFFTAADSYFLQSEAVYRTYMSGDAKALFEAGITASFNLLGATGASAYIAASSGTNLIGWDGSTNKLEAIMTQKWIANMGINGIESWIEYTRTGFPDLPLAITASESSRPNRLLYPASEYSTNSANVPDQSTGDAFTTKIFWDVN
ncbi:SusD/RagB family nutrient-binding outer membrane lipoprotein [Lacinutrix iliipiscaria]|uniref:SusD/RagB family nutrient-binding outer membrane lipoprotein n=1 Tax=Lacinutrix iliipiscaria TaxID=1230532 RepID=A0ABW5WMC5_9FLAO